MLLDCSVTVLHLHSRGVPQILLFQLSQMVYTCITSTVVVNQFMHTFLTKTDKNYLCIICTACFDGLVSNMY